MVDKTPISSAEWISVTERLPKENVKVVVIKNGSSVNDRRFTVACIRGNKWWTPLNKFRILEVTHWMPLPPAPSVGD